MAALDNSNIDMTLSISRYGASVFLNFCASVVLSKLICEQIDEGTLHRVTHL